MATFDLNNTSEANLFRVVYKKFEDRQFNNQTVLNQKIKEQKDFDGKQMEAPIQLSGGAGVGASSLPTASTPDINKITMTRKKLYARVSIDGETIEASEKSVGAFVKATGFSVKSAVSAWNRNFERILMNGDGSGELAAGDGATNVTGAGTAGDPYDVVFDTVANGFIEDNIEVGDIWNYDGESTELLVQAYDSSTRAVELVGTSTGLAALAGSGPVPTTKYFYMQNSKDNEPIGLKGVLDLTSGSYQGNTIGYRYKSYRKSAASSALSTDLMNDVVINVRKQCGEDIDLILCPHAQYIKLLNQLDDQKRFPIETEASKKMKGVLAFEGIEYMTPSGAVPVVISRFMRDDEMFFVNTKRMKIHASPKGRHWKQLDGTVLLREASSDAYEGRYAWYGDVFINPNFQGILHTLAL